MLVLDDYQGGNTPTLLPDAPRIVVIGDVHGDLSRLTKVLLSLGIISRECKWVADPPNTVVVQMGDQLDSASRVPPSMATEWETGGTSSDLDTVVFMDKLDRIAQASGGRVVSLLGNHELMNYLGDFTYVSNPSMIATGGELGRRAHFSAQGNVGAILARRNVVVRIGQLLFVHGGILPHHLEVVGGDLRVINSLARKLFRRESLEPEEMIACQSLFIEPEGLLWTRRYADNGNPALEPMIQAVLASQGAQSIFVGHSTVSRVAPLFAGKLWLMDAMFSRSYGSEQYQVVDIRQNNRDGNSGGPAYNAQIVTFS